MSQDINNYSLPLSLTARAENMIERLIICDMCINDFIDKQPIVKQADPVLQDVTEMSKRIREHVQVIKGILVYYAARHLSHQDLDRINNLVNRGKVMISSLEKLYMTLNWLCLSQEMRDAEEAIEMR
jgi:dGTP triphosphohydrolase